MCHVLLLEVVIFIIRIDTFTFCRETFYWLRKTLSCLNWLHTWITLLLSFFNYHPQTIPSIFELADEKHIIMIAEIFHFPILSAFFLKVVFFQVTDSPYFNFTFFFTYITSLLYILSCQPPLPSLSPRPTLKKKYRPPRILMERDLTHYNKNRHKSSYQGWTRQLSRRKGVL